MIRHAKEFEPADRPAAEGVKRYAPTQPQPRLSSCLSSSSLRWNGLAAWSRVLAYVIAMASNLVAMAFNLVAMAFNSIAMASNL